MVTDIGAWLGLGGSKDSARVPYTARVTYADGSTGDLAFWAVDLREAIGLALYWLTDRSDVPAREITIRRRVEGDR